MWCDLCIFFQKEKALPFNHLTHVLLMDVSARVCGGGFVLPFPLSSELFLSVRLQMLSSAQLGWDWAVRCERDPQQQDWKANKALPCVVMCLWVYSFLARGSNYLLSCNKALNNQHCSFATWLGCRSSGLIQYISYMVNRGLNYVYWLP